MARFSDRGGSPLVLGMTHEEAADCIIHNERKAPSEKLTMVHTPDIHTIEEVCAFLGSSEEGSCKAVVYQRAEDGGYVVLFIRGDLEVNETKLTNFLGSKGYPAVITDACGLKAGYIGPVGLAGDFTVLYDSSLKGLNNISCGANVCEYHYMGLDTERDLPNAEYHDFAKIRENGICPHCGKDDVRVTFKNGTEIKAEKLKISLDNDSREVFFCSLNRKLSAKPIFIKRLFKRKLCGKNGSDKRNKLNRADDYTDYPNDFNSFVEYEY